MSRNKYFLPYQIKWLKDKSPIKLWEKSRRIGATYVQAYEDVEDCIKGRVPAVWFSSSDDSAAKEYIDYCKMWAGIFNAAFEEIEEVIEKTSTHEVRFKNGSKITAGSSNPKFFRSKGGKVVLDEFAFHEDAINLWKAAMACAKIWGHPIRILSTHNGKTSKFFKFIEGIAKGILNWSHHKVDIYDAIGDGLLDKIKGKTTSLQEQKEWLSELRADSGNEETFKEEFCCIAVDEATAFLTYDLIRSCESEIFKKDKQKGTHKGKAWEITTYSHPTLSISNAKNLYLGKDVARRKHLSVIWIAEKRGEVLVTLKVIVLQNCPFAKQEEVLYGLLALPNLVRACIDATGIGEQLSERAQERYGSYKVEAVHFNASSKPAIMFGLLESMENTTITIPNEEVFREDFHSLKKITGVNNQIRFDSEGSDAHSDRAIACALCAEASRTSNAEVWVATRKKQNRQDDGY